MDLTETESEQAFRQELREWLADTLPRLSAPPGRDDWPGRRSYDLGWQHRLFEAGFAGISWPVEHGGRGASPTEELIFLQETEAAGAPYVGCNFVGLGHAGPTIAAEGTAEHKATYLPPILRGETVWCQGFSEPDAGSDLASLRTRAERDDDHYVVTGSKIWTSFAHIADQCELLVRTDPGASKHGGITWLVMAMDSPGIELRPLRTITGESEFSEMFLNDVRIPVANRVGDENDGWRIAMVTFSFERGTAFVSELLASQRMVGELSRLAKTVGRGSGSAWDDAEIRRGLAEVAAELDAQWAFTRRNVSLASKGTSPSLGGSIFKLTYYLTRIKLGDLAMRLLGRAGLAMGDPTGIGGTDHVHERVHALSLSIAAGTAQIHRNIIGERSLGLPKER